VGVSRAFWLKNDQNYELRRRERVRRYKEKEVNKKGHEDYKKEGKRENEEEDRKDRKERKSKV
jgi:hypothetical protein